MQPLTALSLHSAVRTGDRHFFVCVFCHCRRLDENRRPWEQEKSFDSLWFLLTRAICPSHNNALQLVCNVCTTRTVPCAYHVVAGHFEKFMLDTRHHATKYSAPTIVELRYWYTERHARMQISADYVCVCVQRQTQEQCRTCSHTAREWWIIRGRAQIQLYCFRLIYIRFTNKQWVCQVQQLLDSCYHYCACMFGAIVFEYRLWNLHMYRVIIVDTNIFWTLNAN